MDSTACTVLIVWCTGTDVDSGYVVFELVHAIVFQKEIQAEFQHITSELDQLMTSAQKLSENIEGLPGNERDTELQGKLTRLNSKLNEYVKEARTRETLSSALLSEEEKLKTKLIAMEAEQVCCTCKS